jgi:hypothetical protein
MNLAELLPFVSLTPPKPTQIYISPYLHPLTMRFLTTTVLTFSLLTTTLAAYSGCVGGPGVGGWRYNQGDACTNEESVTCSHNMKHRVSLDLAPLCRYYTDTRGATQLGCYSGKWQRMNTCGGLCLVWGSVCGIICTTTRCIKSSELLRSSLPTYHHQNIHRHTTRPTHPHPLTMHLFTTAALTLSLLTSAFASQTPCPGANFSNWQSNQGDACSQERAYTCSHNVKHLVSLDLPPLLLMLY